VRKWFSDPSRGSPRRAAARGARASLAPIALLLVAFISSAGDAAGSGARRAWPREVERAFGTIEPKECLEHISLLASDALEGRAAGEEGGRLASEYIAMRFLESGIEPGGPLGSYFQPFAIMGRSAHSGELRLSNSIRLAKRGAKGEELELLADFSPHAISGEAVTGGGLVYLSAAAAEAEPLPPEVRGRVVVLSVETLSAELARAPAPPASPLPPPSPSPAPPTPLGEPVPPPVPPATDEEIPLDESTLPLARFALAGVRAIVAVTEDETVASFEAAAWPAGELATSAPLPVVALTAKASAKLLRRAGTSLRTAEKATVTEIPEWRALVSVSRRGHPYRMGRNVIGVLPGRDPELASEIVVIGAHFDHVGTAQDPRLTKGTPGEIHNGADDNASGISGLLELAEAFASQPKVERARTLVFIAFDAEEVGLLGSNWYVAHCPLPIEKTVAMINMDMISRNGPQEMYYGKDERFPGLNGIVEGVADYFRIHLDRTGMDQYMERSDQAPFLERGIPAVFLYGGDHPDYHTERDDVSRANPVKIVNIARLMFLCAFECANHRGSFGE